MKTEFTNYEKMILAQNQKSSRQECISYLCETVLPILNMMDDLEDVSHYRDQAQSAVQKLELISDEDYLELDYSEYDGILSGIAEMAKQEEQEDITEEELLRMDDGEE